MKTRKRSRGAATIEFYLVGFFVLLPLLMGILQTGMFMVAKNTVNLAALAAARAGAASSGDPSEMRRALVTGLTPLYVAAGIRVMGGSGFTELSKTNYTTIMPAAFAAANLAWASPSNKLTVLNPSAASFTDFAITDPVTKARLIPHTNLLDDSKIGANSKQTRADALLLKIELRYCYPMVFPIIDKLIAKVLESDLGASVEDRLCYSSVGGTHGIPIKSQAIVRMTTPAIQANFK